jgi:hypothetical protein
MPKKDILKRQTEFKRLRKIEDKLIIFLYKHKIDLIIENNRIQIVSLK